ncbi:Oxidase ustYa [Colletotrichum trifolii]|uniref:Oxidase ustYa n=1 Tax=Colletotrichum trifolii TaxID=5466 RepID=A0A4V3HXB3_COLTR|nr:Oxidase ustYa [Colletotrichum trifolii]
MPTWPKYPRYSKVEQEDDPISESSPSRLAQIWQRARVHVFYITLLILVAFISNHTSARTSQDEYYWAEPVKSTLRLKTVPRVFHLDLDYARPPDATVDAKWASLLPEMGGFFTHPAISPNESCFAVFHQIHCLDMVRQALYEARPDVVGQGWREVEDDDDDGHRRRDSAEDNNHIHDMYHIGHCFDLIRQALMCTPDLTMELTNETIGGVTGFGTEHQCVDWPALMRWMKKYE